MDNVGKWWLWCCGYVLLLVVSLIPVFLTTTLPLSDYSNHLARMYILIHTAHSPTLQQFYEIHWAILPNLAMDIIVPLLASLFSLEVAGKIYVALIFLLISSGTIALHYAIYRRLSPWPFIVFLFLYNSMLILGVMNYLFALGCALWAVAAWAFLRERPNSLFYPFFYGVAVVLFFFHLSAFGFYTLVILAYEAHRFLDPSRPADRRKLLDLACPGGQFIIPAILFIFSETRDNAPLTSYWEWFHKVVAPFSLVYNYNFNLDLFLFISVTELLILGFISRRLTIAKPMRMAVIFIALVFIVTPSTAFNSNYADYRLVPALAFLFISSSDFRLTGINRGWYVLAIAGLASLFVLRVYVISKQWFELDREYGEYLQAIDKLPVGSRLFSVFVKGDDTRMGEGSRRPFNAESVPSYAVIRRSAFVPLIYADRHTMPISFTSDYAKIAAETPGSYFSGGKGAYLRQDSHLDWVKIKQNYNYWLIGRENLLKSPLPSGLELLFSGHDFHLYKVIY